MTTAEEESVMVQGVTDEEKTFDDPCFGIRMSSGMKDVGLDKRILKAIHEMGYAHPTLVQVRTREDGHGCRHSPFLLSFPERISW